MNEEYAVMCQSKQHADTARQQEIDQLVGERHRSHLEFMEETKEGGALRREMLRKDERIMQLQPSLEQANLAPSVSSWQHTPILLMMEKKRSYATPWTAGRLHV